MSTMIAQRIERETGNFKAKGKVKTNVLWCLVVVVRCIPLCGHLWKSLPFTIFLMAWRN